MQKATSNTIIRIYSMLFWLIGLLLLARSFGFPIDTSELQAIFGASDAVLRVAAFLLGAFLLIVGYFVQKHKKWARNAALFISSVLVIGGTFFLVRCEEIVCTTWLLGMPLNVVRVLVGAFGLWFFGHEAEHTFR